MKWLKPVEDLISFQKPEQKQQQQPIEHKPKPMEEVTKEEVVKIFDDPDGHWTEKKNRRIDWEAFNNWDRKYLAEYFAEHRDHTVRELSCCPLSMWDRGDILLKYLKDVCSGVRSSAALYLEDVSESQEIADCLWSVFNDSSVYGTLADFAISAYVIHEQHPDLEDRLLNVVTHEPKPSKKVAAMLELRGLNAHTHMRSLLPMLAEPPIVDWQIHVSLIDYCGWNEVPIPHLSELGEIDHTDVQYSLASAMPRCQPVLLKGLSYAARI
jgi:hypothetical protein